MATLAAVSRTPTNIVNAWNVSEVPHAGRQTVKSTAVVWKTTTISNAYLRVFFAARRKYPFSWTHYGLILGLEVDTGALCGHVSLLRYHDNIINKTVYFVEHNIINKRSPFTKRSNNNSLIASLHTYMAHQDGTVPQSSHYFLGKQRLLCGTVPYDYTVYINDWASRDATGTVHIYVYISCTQM